MVEGGQTGSGTYIIRLLFGLHIEVVLVRDDRAGQLFHFKALAFLLLLPSEGLRLGVRHEGVKRRSQGSRGSVGAVRHVHSQAGGIPLPVLGVWDFCCSSTRHLITIIMIKQIQILQARRSFPEAIPDETWTETV